MPFSDQALARLRADAADIIGRYPRSRSALLPLLHLVQSEDGYVSEDGIKFCAETLGCTETEVVGVATFYTMYKHSPAGEYQVGVCTNTLCAIMGGDQIYAELAQHLGADPHAHDAASPGGRPPKTPPGHGGIVSADRKVGIERVECNAACDYAPVVMVNWEFFDNMTPEKAKKLVDDLRAGNKVTPTRGPDRLCTWKQSARILAGFGDGQATEGPSAGPASLVGLELAKEHGWSAPAPKASQPTNKDAK
ncbi:MAG TPA: NAD(P)H-dependent oxidoreductase subunit E [Trebonia sp.]|jgi:NADH-quinone oxidoreductase subunit E|nr:NAD(P)H-dependent oxidoreductase subunit E [Trebonia sp.]